MATEIQNEDCLQPYHLITSVCWSALLCNPHLSVQLENEMGHSAIILEIEFYTYPFT